MTNRCAQHTDKVSLHSHIDGSRSNSISSPNRQGDGADKNTNKLLDNGQDVSVETSSRWFRVSQTVSIYASGFVLGLTSGVFGPTMVHVTILYGCSMAEMTRGFAVNNATYFLGSLLTALVFDWFNARLFHSSVLLTLSACIGLAPFMPNIYGYQGLVAIVTFTQGIVQSSVPGLLFKLWFDHRLRSPLLQLYYTIWGVGLFLSPLVAMPFLADLPPECRKLTVSHSIEQMHSGRIRYMERYFSLRVARSSNQSFGNIH